MIPYFSPGAAFGVISRSPRAGRPGVQGVRGAGRPPRCVGELHPHPLLNDMTQRHNYERSGRPLTAMTFRGVCRCAGRSSHYGHDLFSAPTAQTMMGLPMNRVEQLGFDPRQTGAKQT